MSRADIPGEPARLAPGLKRLLLAFWAIWLSLVFTTNVLDGAKALKLLDKDWLFASGNYHFLAETTKRYGTPDWINGVLFLAVLGWEGLAAILFWVAFRLYRGRGSRWVYAAFTAGLSLWAAFTVADEVFIAYTVEAVHLRLFTAQLATLLAIELLPGTTNHGGAGPEERQN